MTTGGMTDADLLGKAPAVVAPAAKSGDPAIWTVLGEAGSHAEGQKAVASTIMHRLHASGRAQAADVIADPANGYEAWQNPTTRAGLQQKYPVGSPAYVAATQNVGPILAGQIDPPYAYDSFYSPEAQRTLGRKPPGFEDGSGVDIGGNRFFAGKATAPILSAEDEALWAKMQGGRGVAISPTDTTPEPGKPSDPQTQTAKFLALHNFSMEEAPKGSSQNPLYETDASGPPTQPGLWYVPRAGGLRQAGDPTDYLPAYQKLAADRGEARSQPIANRLLAGGGMGLEDIGGSLNKLLGGSLGASPEGQFVGEDYTAPTDRAAAEGYTDARNRFDLLRSGDPVAATGRVGGQILGTAPFMAAGGALLEGAGPPGAFLAGASRGGPLLTIGSRAVGGAIQGAETGALTSGTSDRPLAEQVASGTVAGTVTGPLAGALGDATVGRAGQVFSDARVSPAAATLARTAMDTYGIPLRRLQIIGTGDRAAAVADSEMLSRTGTGGMANHQAQRQAFTRAVAGTFGERADALTPAVMQRARTRIGGVMNDVAARTTITDTDGLQTQLGRIVHDAQQVLPEGEVTPLLRQVENINSAINDGRLSGESYQALTRKGSPLEVATNSSNPNIRHYAQQIRDELDEALTTAATPEDAHALQQARWQYKNLMTLKNLAVKAGVDGEISPALLNGAVNSSFKNRAFRGAGDLGELAQIGQTFMKEPPNSGTAARLASIFKNNLLTLGGAAGAGGTQFLAHDPGLALKLAGVSAAAGATKYGINAASGAINNSRTLANLLVRPADQQGGTSAVFDALRTIRGVVRPSQVPALVDAQNQLLGTDQPH